MSRGFRCPYCFSICEENKVYFRATRGFSAEELATLLPGQSPEEQRALRRFEKNKIDSPALEKQVRFWEPRGGTRAMIAGDPDWDMPYLNPSDPMFAEMIRADHTGTWKVGSDGFVRDSSGFVIRVVDRYGSPERPMQRLCPHCLNPFPLSDYGKYHICMIGLAGISGAGKSVYLSQLLVQLRKNGARTGLKPQEDNFDAVMGAQSRLPGPTPADRICRPLAVNLLTEDEKKGVTLVFYDTAGEQFSRSKSSGSGLAELDCLQNCDALMLVVEPQQIKKGNSGKRVPLDRLQEVLEYLKNLRQEKWASVPVSVILTKCEGFREDPDFQPVWQQIQAFDGLYQEERIKPGQFPREDFLQANQMLRKLLYKELPEAVEIFQQMENPAYFAVAGVENGIFKKLQLDEKIYEVSPEDIQKVQLTRLWVQEWNLYGTQSYSDCIQARQQMPECPCGFVSQIWFGQQLEKTALQDIQTKIQGREESDGTVHTFTLEEILTAKICSYARDHFRIQSGLLPLQWCLWQLGIMGPIFQSRPVPEQPRRGFLRKKEMPDDRWAALWEAVCRQARSRFYNGEEDYLSPIEEFERVHGLSCQTGKHG